MKININSRRNFIKQNSIIGLGIIATTSLTKCKSSEPNSHESSVDDGRLRTISDLNIKLLREKYSEALFKKFLPNMDKFVVDHEFGGFMCSIDILTRKLENTNKRTWFLGRGIWAYSFLYNNLDDNAQYLDIAGKAKDFILKLLPPDDKFYTTAFSREGKPLSDEEGDIYGNLFVAEGLTEFSKAINEEEYLEKAKNLVLRAVERYDQSDFTYPYKAEKRVKGPRILGHWMILLHVATQMLKQKDDVEIQALADRCVNAIMNKHLNPESGMLNEALDHDLNSLTDPVASQFGDIGHGCETLAFVMNYAIFRKDAELFKKSADAFKYHVTVAKDDIYGGHFHSLDNINENIWNLQKVRWLQEEILNGCLTLIEHNEDEWALNKYAETEAYIRDKYVHSDYAFVIDYGNRKMEIHNMIRAENYHHPRQLMYGILAIDRMLDRDEKPSGMFG